jgi:serine/threonine protein phosphatase 1
MAEGGSLAGARPAHVGAPREVPLARRTIAIGDIHGDFAQLEELFRRLPALDGECTLVFLGDYLDRGPHPARVVEFVRHLPESTPAKVVALRGSHEDAWLKVRREGWAEFLFPLKNGCLDSLRSFTGGRAPALDEVPSMEDYQAMERASFFPEDVITWMGSLPCYYEDEHAIYVHAGLPEGDGRWLHPSEAVDPEPLLWQRSRRFFETYKGKRVVFGHTSTDYLPQEHSCYTPEDAKDGFVAGDLVGIDTACGRGGFLTAVELPALVMYESRPRP